MIRISNELIQSVLLTYQKQIADKVSDEYRFFSMLNQLKENDYELFSRAFTALDDELFAPSDFYKYTSDLDFKSDSNSLLLFIDSLQAPINKVSNIKEKLLTKSYVIYGNMNAYLTNLFKDPDSKLFLKKIENKDTLEPMLTPIIRYGAGQVLENAYPSYLKAEEDYWDIVGEWLTSNTKPTPTIGILNRVVESIFNEKYKGRIYNSPTLFKSTVDRARYSKENDIDSAIISMIKDSYLALSIAEVYSFIDKMIEGFINYNDYDYNSPTMPDIREYSIVRINELNAINNTDITFDNLKEIIFYVNFISLFFNIDNASLNSKLITILGEILATKQSILNLRSKLLQDGYFTE
jgi:hypothetical protein